MTDFNDESKYVDEDFDFDFDPEIEERKDDHHNHKFKDFYIGIAQKINTFGKTRTNTSAVLELNKSNNIILVGLPRVGKSQTITVLSGKEVQVSPGLFSCTQKIERFDSEGMTYWDTPGIESWKASDVDDFMDKIFLKNRILPMSIIIVFAPGCFVAQNPVKRFVDLARKYKIQVIFEITKAFSLDREQFSSYSQTVVELTGTNVMRRLESPFKYVKEMDDNMFLIYVNLKPFTSLKGVETRDFGIKDLKRVLFTKQDQSTKESLVRLYSDTAGFWERAGAFGFDLMYAVGVPIEKTLTTEEREVYEKLSRGERIDPEILSHIVKYLKK